MLKLSRKVDECKPLRHGMSQQLINALTYANLAFTALFTIEISIKLIGSGLWDFCNDNFNIFDAVIVFFALVEVVALGGSTFTAGAYTRSLLSST